MEDVKLTSEQAAAEREKAADEAAQVRYLKPGVFEVFEEEGIYRLTLPNDRTYLKFNAFRTYPLSLPEKYISLRDINEEIGIIRDLAEFDKYTQTVIRELLARRYFVPRIKSIISTRQRYGGMIWEIDTDRGTKTIITKGIHEALLENSLGIYFLTDVDGNRYEILMDEISPESAAWIRSMV